MPQKTARLSTLTELKECYLQDEEKQLIFKKNLTYTKIKNKIKNLKSQLDTALRRYTYPGFDGYPLSFEELGDRSDDDAIEIAVQFERELPISAIQRLEEVQQRVFDQQKDNISDEVIRHNRNQIKKLLKWCKKQSWYKTATKGRPRIAPSKAERGVRRITQDDRRLTNRCYTKEQWEFGLTDAELSQNSHLKQELENFRKFLTAPDWNGRKEKAVKDTTAESKIKNVRRMLGWLHRYKGIPLTQLSLKLLIPSSGRYEVSTELRKNVIQLSLKLASGEINTESFLLAVMETSSLSESEKNKKQNEARFAASQIVFEYITWLGTERLPLLDGQKNE